MYKYLKRKNNKQNKGSEIYWAFGHFSAVYVSWYVHKEHSNMTLEMEYKAGPPNPLWGGVKRDALPPPDKSKGDK